MLKSTRPHLGQPTPGPRGKGGKGRGSADGDEKKMGRARAKSKLKSHRNEAWIHPHLSPLISPLVASRPPPRVISSFPSLSFGLEIPEGLALFPKPHSEFYVLLSFSPLSEHIH